MTDDRIFFTADGKMIVPQPVAAAHFPHNVFVGSVRDGDLILHPLRGLVAGGLILKQRNMAGDRSVIIWEVTGRDLPAGWRPATWDDAVGGLRVPLSEVLDE